MSSSSNLPKIIVKAVRVVAHTMGPVTPGAQLSQNHWSIFFLDGSGGAVRIRMQLADPISTKLDGKLDIKLYNYEVTNSAVKYWDFAVPSGLTVAAILSLIKDRGRSRYIVAEGGVGCRHWTVTFIHDMEYKGYVAKQTATGDKIDDIMQYNYSRGQVPVKLAMKKGTFG